MNQNSNQWFAATVVALPEAAEAVESAFNALDALGTEINNLGPNQPDFLKVVGYFNASPDLSDISLRLAEAIEIYNLDPDAAIFDSVREVKNEDWLAEWKKHWKPTESDRFIIAPTWETIDETEKIVIRIEPSMAFGTGTHETTRLCLKALEHRYAPGESFFDVGTGTGILAIAVAKLNPSPVSIVGCDTDEDSITIAKENTEFNGCGAIELFVGSISPESPEFDVVCANVTLDVIVPLLPLLVQKSHRLLILSGILAEQETAIREALRGFGFAQPEIEKLGEWISVIVSK